MASSSCALSAATGVLSWCAASAMKRFCNVSAWSRRATQLVRWPAAAGALRRARRRDASGSSRGVERAATARRRRSRGASPCVTPTQTAAQRHDDQQAPAAAPPRARSRGRARLRFTRVSATRTSARRAHRRQLGATAQLAPCEPGARARSRRRRSRDVAALGPEWPEWPRRRSTRPSCRVTAKKMRSVEVAQQDVARIGRKIQRHAAAVAPRCSEMSRAISTRERS